MSLISGLSSIKLGQSYPVNGAGRAVTYQPFAKETVAPVKYNLECPRHNDSDGVSGESHLAKKLDFIS